MVVVYEIANSRPETVSRQISRFSFCKKYDCVVLKLNKNNQAKKATPTIFPKFLGLKDLVYFKFF
jgi:hypothetical protein